MFYFLHSEQDQSNASYFKGLLFEDLLARYLEASGYVIDELRRKSRSLEYDLVAHHELDGRRVIGEAKAHEAPIGSQDISAFVGKYSSEYFRDKILVGLFLSTSPLTPDGQDFLRGLGSSPFTIRQHCGDALEESVRTKMDFPSESQVARTLQSWIPYPQAQHFLHTDFGSFIVVVGAGASGGFPDRCALVRPDGQVVSDQGLYQRLREALPPLQELEAVPSTDQVPLPERPLATGIVEATDWVDFRHPTGEAFFVGRGAALSRLDSLLSSDTGNGIVELKARSGVGKSSALLVLKERWLRAGNEVQVHDARDIRSSSDVFAVVSAFLKRRVSSFRDLDEALASFSKKLGNERRAAILVDQFETSLTSPEVFGAYDYLARAVAAVPRIGLVFARKDDLLTTHDELQVNLDRLRDLSTPVSLDDLTRGEAAELIRAAVAAVNASVGQNVLAQVLEFAQGFPWLLKRTLAHVFELVDAGVSPSELESSGLHLQDLFQEEVSGLDEVERGYLTRLAAVLPATHRALMQRFDDDPALPRVLDQLTKRRVLRHSAGTYDTYNDVLKDYLLFQRLPERAHSYLFRLRPGPVLDAFRTLRSQTRWELEGLQTALQRPIGSTYNLVRELRLLGLVQKVKGAWEVPEAARDYEHRSRLGEYVRQSVLKNQAVVVLLARLEASAQLSPADVIVFLKEHFTFVEANNAAWESYAGQFAAWLTALRLARELSTGDLVAEHEDREAVLNELGNLNIPFRGSRPADAPFVPSHGWATVDHLFEIAATDHDEALSKSQRTLLRELHSFDVFSLSGDRGLVALVSQEHFELRMRQLMGEAPYTDYWAFLESGGGYVDAIKSSFGFENLADGTLLALAKKLANWGRRLGFLPGRRRYPSVGKPRAEAGEQGALPGL